MALSLLAVLLPATCAQALPPEAQPGDLIFRRGTSLDSAVVLSVDGGEFSHVGMLLGAPGAWQVIHAVPSEVPGRDDGVVIDELAFFLDPARSQTHAVYHVQASPEQRAQAIEQALAARGLTFRLADPAGTYCTLLIWRAWLDAGLDLEVSFTPLTLPLMQGDYLLPGPLARSRHLRRGDPEQAQTR
ncbi:hypothetical protein AXK12_02995 [Cephaloticoccus capnophilus]|uniref:Permuted papain-like amidase YaeF/Yiix C92 family enzyme n=1 Tax=Cephaloticoccus capnophilus TaxID=1548208 RepID=A0A139SQE8_9BACT|nr:hypothetical protein AXK12_02995 [Cephaloticoccus capnophilus]